MNEPEPEFPAVVLEPVERAPAGWRSRMARSAGLAVVAATAVALGTAALLEAVREPRQVHPAASAAAAAASAAASGARTPIPERTRRPDPSHVSGSLPDRFVAPGFTLTGHVLLRSERLELLDLATGVRVPLGGESWSDRVMRLASGGYLCLCRELLDRAVGISFIRFDGAGRRLDSRRVLEARGKAPPGWEAAEFLSWNVALSADGRSLYLATAVRDPSNWTVSVHAIDLSDGRLLNSIELASLSNELPDARPGSTSPSGGPNTFDGVYVQAPTLAVGPDGRSILVSVTVATQRGENQTLDRRGWSVDLAARGALRGWHEHAAGHGVFDPNCWEPPMLLRGDAVAYCVPPDGKAFVRRVPASGGPPHDVRIDSLPAPIGLPVAHAPTGTMYGWDPFNHTLARFDPWSADELAITRVDPEEFEAGEFEPTGAGSDDDTVEGVIGALRAWAAPSALAKIWLEPALAVSADGTRLYAIGTHAGPHEVGGSSGVWVLDAASLEVVDHWQPTADLVSIELSADGSLLYAIGSPGRDATGQETSWPASLTAYSTDTGEAVAVIGDLGPNMAMLLGPGAG